MRTTNLNLLSCRAFIVLLFAAVTSHSASAGVLQLEYHDFREALKQARANDLPMIVHFYTQWCGPCRTMEQTVFRSHQLKDALTGKIILVKVDAERSTDLARMYQISQYPTDIYLDTDGRVLSVSSGGMSLDNYIGRALQVAGRYQQSKKIFVARKRSGNDPSPTASFEVNLGQSAPFPRELMEPMVAGAKKGSGLKNGQSVSDPRGFSTPGAKKKSNLVFVAIDGFCPVKLNKGRAWIRGNKKWVAEYRHQKYRFSGAEQRDLFNADPQRYAPRLLGCDPVIMWESDRAIPGSTEFAAYYNDNLYLFTGEENRELFQIDPERYINTRHVLAPRYVEATLIR